MQLQMLKNLLMDFVFRSIVIDPNKGLLYYSTWASGNSIGQIMVAWMDGTHRSIFVDKCNEPTSLTIDYNNDQLYWCDPSMEQIERIGLDGKNREIIIKHNSIAGNFNPFSMAYHNNFIYFTDTSSGNITKVSLENIDNVV